MSAILTTAPAESVPGAATAVVSPGFARPRQVQTLSINLVQEQAFKYGRSHTLAPSGDVDFMAFVKLARSVRIVNANAEMRSAPHVAAGRFEMGFIPRSESVERIPHYSGFYTWGYNSTMASVALSLSLDISQSPFSDEALPLVTAGSVRLYDVDDKGKYTPDAKHSAHMDAPQFTGHGQQVVLALAAYDGTRDNHAGLVRVQWILAVEFLGPALYM